MLKFLLYMFLLELVVVLVTGIGGMLIDLLPLI